MDPSQLPALNAGLNALAAVLLVAGRRLARSGRIEAHRRVMGLAFATSTLFLASYVLHKVSRNFENTTFAAEGLVRTLYLLLLASHVLLAATVPFLAVALIVLGLRDRRAAHRRLARIAWPVWLYVSATGVAIYFLLYHLNPVLLGA